MKQGWFKIILYGSLVFLVIALAKGNYLAVPTVEHPLLLAFSFPLLFAGFLFMTVYWQLMLRVGGVTTSFFHSVASIGLSIFAKYIPGKIWVILGRAAYIAERESASKVTTASLSLHAQIMSLWTGLLLGGGALLFTDNDSRYHYGLPMLAIWLVFTMIVFTPWFNRIAMRAIKAVSGREVLLPVISLRHIVSAIPFFFFNWLSWCFSFYLLCQALVVDEVPLVLGLGFALAGTLGILAVIVPGGLGVREGILAWYLVHLGLDKPTALTVSVASRLWFLTGEVFIFALGGILSRRSVAGKATLHSRD